MGGEIEGQADSKVGEKEKEGEGEGEQAQAESASFLKEKHPADAKIAAQGEEEKIEEISAEEGCPLGKSGHLRPGEGEAHEGDPQFRVALRVKDEDGESAKEGREQKGQGLLRQMGGDPSEKKGDECPNCRQKEGQNHHCRKEEQHRLQGREPHEIQGIHADKPIKPAEVKAPKGKKALHVKPSQGDTPLHKAEEPRPQGGNKEEGEGGESGEGEGEGKKKPEEDGEEEPSPSGRVALKKRAK
jgi:hypothetical protein